eukprot:4117140-Amphidinium_carterae.1
MHPGWARRVRKQSLQGRPHRTILGLPRHWCRRQPLSHATQKAAERHAIVRILSQQRYKRHRPTEDETKKAVRPPPLRTGSHDSAEGPYRACPAVLPETREPLLDRPEHAAATNIDKTPEHT